MESQNDKEVVKYYDEQFSEYQKKMFINERHLMCVEFLIANGLKRNSNVLELGCGIGTITGLISEFVTKGEIRAYDLSPKSIEIASKKFKGSNISFGSGDIVSLEIPKDSYSFVTLFDVIEHVPISSHDKLFSNISRLCNEDTKIVINIPNPRSIEYARINEPESLQIIDQAIFLDGLLEVIGNAGLKLDYFESYSIWHKGDYHRMVLSKESLFNKKPDPVNPFHLKLKRRIRNLGSIFK